MRILMIDDDETLREGIKLRCEDEGYSFKGIDFPQDYLEIEKEDPDLIILDLKDSDDQFTGDDYLSNIWEKNFRPVCVFSGQLSEERIGSDTYNSPLIKLLEKGYPEQLMAFIKEIEPYAKSIKSMQTKMHDAFRRSFDVLKFVMKDQITDENIIGYLCNNRIREAFSNEGEEIKLPSWGQYIYPVLSQHFSTGDIVCEKRKYNSDTSAKNFYVILSQSCDLAHKKVDKVLLAKCCSINSIVKNKEGKLIQREELTSILNAGFRGSLFPLPKLKDVIPELVINLKDLFLVDINSFSTQYQTIVSLSSPYRERLVWAYMQNACRPGVPTLDVEKWAESIIQDNGSNES